MSVFYKADICFFFTFALAMKRTTEKECMNKFRKIALYCLTFVFALSANAQTKVKAENPEEIELVSIVSHLALVNGYDWDAEDVGVDDYLAEVDSTFAPYREHPIVPFIRKKLLNNGFNWHFPMHVALRLHIKNGKIKYDKNLVPDFDDYYDRISREDEKQFIKLLQNFYNVSHFHDFFVRHKALYAECETAMRRVIEQVDFSWYDSFFGPRENSTFHIYTNILVGPANYAIHQKRKDGVEIINALMGCCNRSKQGDIYYDTYSTLPIIIHECNHSYCNPLNEEFWSQLSEKMEAFFAPNAKHYTDEAYGNAQYVLNETFVEASVMRYLMTHPFDFTENTKRWLKVLKVSDEQLEAAPDKVALLNDAYIKLLTKIDYEDKRFYMIHDVIDALGEREQHRDLYPTMHNFMPRYIEVVNTYKSK